MTRPNIARAEAVAFLALAVVAAVLLLTLPARSDAAGQGVGHGSAVFATEAPAVEVCFRTADWDARGEDRPCDVLERPQEDGSGRLTLGTLGADAAVCVVPNPYEERGRFAIRCRRVPSR